MHIHVCRPIFDFIFNKVLIFLNLNAHKMHNWVISSYFEIMEFLGCYSFGSPSILMRPRSLKPWLHAIHDFQMCHVVLRFILWVYTYRVPTTIRPMTKWLHHDVLGWFMQYSHNCSIEWVKATQYLAEEFLFNSSLDTGLDTLQASDYSVLVTIFTNQSSYLLLGRTHLTRCHCFHCDNTMNPRLVSVVQNFLVYRVWAATALLPASVYPSRLRYHNSD